ncbi:hypothetical protein [Microcystis aeruginosa]|uniref:Transposase n=1 Tax=Microcystis aeruginosa PCC 9701 TaxID=721123 RepID=I4IV19_MICAE|nr:hypothetical protein [Microcystis aeruginosa]CCI38143.1 conserved hypothetical protein [Microcystis aeruginosa PCC 9701]
MPSGIEVKNLKFPMESCSIFYFAYSPELQPAERLWSLVDEPLVNEYFETIEERSEILITRCQYLEKITNEIKNLTNYHWLTYG